MNGLGMLQAQQPAANPEGLIKPMSSLDQTETVRRLHDAIIEHRMSLVAEVDHAEAASDAGLSLLPMEVLVFGNALAGTPLMQAIPTIGIDLPLKVLVWTDEEGMTWLAYNDPAWLAARHGAPSGTKPIVDTMRRLRTIVVDTAAGHNQAEGGKSLSERGRTLLRYRFSKTSAAGRIVRPGPEHPHDLLRSGSAPCRSARISTQCPKTQR